MIVYNVKRRFFAKKTDADRYRVDQGLPPSATIPLRIESRDELAVLLTELCDPGTFGPIAENVVPAKVVDAAFVPPATNVPKFIRESWSKYAKLRGEA